MEPSFKRDHSDLEQDLPQITLNRTNTNIQMPGFIQPYFEEFKQSEPTNLDDIAKTVAFLSQAKTANG